MHLNSVVPKIKHLSVNMCANTYQQNNILCLTNLLNLEVGL